MKKIRRTAIVGMGALGLLYGEQIMDAFGYEAVSFLMDEERFKRHKEDVYTINGKVMHFNVTRVSKAEPADLIIVATKSTGLESALEVMAPAVGEDTIIISVLNGISSEGVIAERFGEDRVLGCVAIGMDAMREGSTMEYVSKGRLQIGILKKGQEEMLERVVTFFDEIGQAYEVKEDIMQAMWGKFLLNVGVNQSCMIYETSYAGVLEEGEIRENMLKVMQEVLVVGQAEGIAIGEADLQRALAVTAGLKPDGYPSMRQDAIAHRATEVELFAGTIMKIAAKHGIEVPANTAYYQKIKEIEAKYS
ncbi:MAG: ketopantoate reductase family protein [Lachnospiraceae bacterium]|nr:ketopantoate reductase family protein [Lachnospiraceae bacterium]